VAGLLKLYLRELPEPLMTFRLYESFIAAVRRSRDWEEIQYASLLCAAPRHHTHTHTHRAFMQRFS
jgi:hypothetical protein